MPDVEARVSESKRISFIWFIPILALVLGVWMVVSTIRSQGPEINIQFPTAEGVSAEKTRIRVLNVDIGIVEAVGLTKDLENVVVTARIDKTAAKLLRRDTQFWVVRPRIGATGISGLGTAFSGAYIQLEPGTEKAGRRDFVGLKDPPVTPVGVPGLRLELVSHHASSVSTGNPIQHKGFTIGRIESAELDVTTQLMHYRAFVRAPYNELVNSATRFWDVSGISVRGDASGLEIEADALETLLVGGVALGLPEGVRAGQPAQDGETFRLYRDYAQVNEQPYREALEYVASFVQSVRGLEPGAPVEYRGLRVGHVERILLEELTDETLPASGAGIPVLLQLEPGRIKLPDDDEGAKELEETVRLGVGAGLRASLATGSLLTGKKYIQLDYFPGEPSASLGTFAGYPEIPSVAGGLEGLQQQVAVLLGKINDLPLEETVRSANQTLAGFNTLVESEEIRAIPTTLESTLAELRATLNSVSADSPLQTQLLRTTTELDRSLHSLRRLLQTLEEKPNALIFNRASEKDPQPSSGTP